MTDLSPASAAEGTYRDPTTEEGKPNIRHWIAQLKGAKRAAKETLKAADDAWREFLGALTQEPTLKAPIAQPQTKYPIYWASVRTIQPAIYSRTPDVVVEKIFETLEDNLARLSSIALERIGKYCIKSNPFDRVQYATRDDFIHVGKTTNRICLDSNISQTPSKKYYTQAEAPQSEDQQEPPPEQQLEQQQPPPQDPNQPPMPPAPPMQPPPPQLVWMNDEGEPLPEGAELQEDEQGFYVEDVEEALDRVNVNLIPVSFRDILHTPNARHWEEIDWIDFKSMMTKEDVRDRFGDEIAEKITYSSHDGDEDRADAPEEKEAPVPVLYAEVHEVWNKRKKEVYWLCLNYADDFLDVKPDIYELDGFFPCPPFMLGTVGPDDLYAIPDYVQLRPLILQLHGMANRLKTLVFAVKRRGIYDASVPELADLGSTTGEAEFLAVNQFAQQITQKGGLDQIVQFFPTDEIVSAVNQMVQLMQQYEDAFNQIYGIPDILRGVSDPNETAAAQQLKGKFLSLRFSAVQREFQRLVRDDIELMCDLAIKKFPVEKLEDICGVNYWAPEDQELWQQVVMLLQDDCERKVRIDIETDSTITMNQAEDVVQRNYLAKTLFDGIAACSSAMQQSPQMGVVGMEALLHVVQAVRHGKELESKLAAAIKEMSKPPEGPPPPDPAMVKAQAQAQAQQTRAQADIAIANNKAQAEMAQDSAKTQHEMGLEQMKLEHDRSVGEYRAQIEMMKAQMKAELEQQMAAHKMALEAMHARINEQTNAQIQRKEAAQAFETPPPGSEQVHIHLAPESNTIKVP